MMKLQNIEKNVLFQFIENIPQFVWWKDLDSIFLGCNERTAQYVGLNSAHEIIGLSDYDIYESKEDADSVIRTDQEIISTGKAQLNFEEYLNMANLGKRWLSTSKIPMFDDDKNIIGTIGWFNDITEIKEMQIELDEKNKMFFNYSLQLKKALKTLEIVNIDLERFTYAASHDIKSPLNLIKSYTEFLLDDKNNKLSSESIESIEMIAKSVKRMDLFVSNMLDYALSGSKHLIAESVDLNEIISEKISDLDYTDEVKSNINIKLPDTKIKAFKQLIGLVFYNLINNGLKFNNSVIPEVSIEYSESDKEWIFHIIDNGIGIEDNMKNIIFEPFKRLKTNGTQGSGIGLSICKRVVGLHQGKIWVDKCTQGNTKFNFTISKSL